jgi:hypothetical protein
MKQQASNDTTTFLLVLLQSLLLHCHLQHQEAGLQGGGGARGLPVGAAGVPARDI